VFIFVLINRRLPTAGVQWPATPTAVNNTTATALAYGSHQPTILAAYPTQQGGNYTVSTTPRMQALF